MAARVFRGGSDEAVGYLDAMVGLYATVFAEPPYRERADAAQRFRRWLGEELGEPGFELVGAVDDGELVGMAYGYGMAAGRWWSDAVEPPPVAVAGVAKFVIMEWAVLSRRRGTGLGRTLMDTLLAGRAERYASLCANPAAPAHDIYLRWGWQPAGRTESGHSPPMTIMVKQLHHDDPGCHAV